MIWSEAVPWVERWAPIIGTIDTVANDRGSLQDNKKKHNSDDHKSDVASSERHTIDASGGVANAARNGALGSSQANQERNVDAGEKEQRYDALKDHVHPDVDELTELGRLADAREVRVNDRERRLTATTRRFEHAKRFGARVELEKARRAVD